MHRRIVVGLTVSLLAPVVSACGTSTSASPPTSIDVAKVPATPSSRRLNPLNLLLIGSESLGRLDYDAAPLLEECLRDQGWSISIKRGEPPAQSVAQRRSAAVQGREYDRTGVAQLVEQTASFYLGIENEDDQTRFAHDLGGADNGGVGTGCLEDSYAKVRSRWFFTPAEQEKYAPLIVGALTGEAMKIADTAYQRCMGAQGFTDVTSRDVMDLASEAGVDAPGLLAADDQCWSANFDDVIFSVSRGVLDALTADGALAPGADKEILFIPTSDA